MQIIPKAFIARKYDVHLFLSYDHQSFFVFLYILDFINVMYEILYPKTNLLCDLLMICLLNYVISPYIHHAD